MRWWGEKFLAPTATRTPIIQPVARRYTTEQSRKENVSLQSVMVISRHQNAGQNYKIRTDNKQLEISESLERQQPIKIVLTKNLGTWLVSDSSEYFFPSLLLSENVKIKVHRTTILPVVLYGGVKWNSFSGRMWPVGRQVYSVIEFYSKTSCHFQFTLPIFGNAWSLASTLPKLLLGTIIKHINDLYSIYVVYKCIPNLCPRFEPQQMEMKCCWETKCGGGGWMGGGDSGCL
jgi:hypothetical protein